MVSCYGSFCTSFHVVTYGAFFEFINLFLTYPVCMIYPAKKILFVLYRALSLEQYIYISCKKIFNSNRELLVYKDHAAN